MPISEHTRIAIRYWEKRRLVFGAVTAGLLIWSYSLTSGTQVGLGYRQSGSFPHSLSMLVVTFLLLNISYTLVYAAERIFCSSPYVTFWLKWGRGVLFFVGLAAASIVALRVGGRIGIYEFSSI